MAHLDPWSSEPPARPLPRRTSGGAWERLERLDRPGRFPPEAQPTSGRRSFGAWWAAGIPLLASAVAWLFLRAIPCSGKACVVPGAAGWGASLLAVPTAPLAGLPWQSGPVALAIAAASSTALWLAIGVWSMQRARDGGRATTQVIWLAAAVWLGSLTGLLVGTLALAR
jgi:hypothetical protein